MNRLQLDGFILGGAGGETWKVVEPRWWQLQRWIKYWVSRESKSTMTITINDVAHIVRVIRAPMKLSRVPSRGIRASKT